MMHGILMLFKINFLFYSYAIDFETVFQFFQFKTNFIDHRKTHEFIMTKEE